MSGKASRSRSHRRSRAATTSSSLCGAGAERAPRCDGQRPRPFTFAAANQTPIVAPPAGGGGGVVVAGAPALVSSSPDDGSTVRQVSSITLTANQSVAWTNLTVTRPDGSVAHAPERRGAERHLAVRDERRRPLRHSRHARRRRPDHRRALPLLDLDAPGRPGTATRPRWRRTARRSTAGEVQAPTGSSRSSGRPARSATTSSSTSRRSSRPRSRRSRGAPSSQVTAFSRARTRRSHSSAGSSTSASRMRRRARMPRARKTAITWRDIPQLQTLNLPARPAGRLVPRLRRHDPRARDAPELFRARRPGSQRRSSRCGS